MHTPHEPASAARDSSAYTPPSVTGRSGEHGLACGCAAGMALATAGTWLRFAMERTARIDTHTWPFVLASAVSGAGLLATGVCVVRLAPRASRLSWRALWGWALATQGVAFSALALTSSDVFTNLCFGALSLLGLSPYTHSPAALGASPLAQLVPARWVNDPSPYGPLFLPVVRAAAWAGSGTFWGTFFSYKALLLAATLAALGIAARHLRARLPSRAAEVFAVLAIGPLVAWEVTAQGHNEGLLFLALVAFLAAAAAGREGWAVCALTAGVATKYALAPLLALYLVLTARRSPRRAVALAALALLLLAACFAPEWHSVTLRAVMPMVGGEAARHAHSFTDLVCLVLDTLALPTASLLAYRLLSTASALLCAALLARVAWRARTLAELAHGYLLFLLALYLTTPWFQPWYLCWGLPLLLLEPDREWQRFFALFSVVTVVQWAAPLDPVTTVMADLWAVSRMWRLSRPASEETISSAA
jgi:hypothetical protein